MRRCMNLALGISFLVGASAAFGQVSEHARSLAPYVPSPPQIVEKMLEAAELKANEVVYDLGSGDGRVLITAAKRFHAMAVGVEISPKLAKEATERIHAEGLDERARVIEGDAMQVDLSEADVVVLYLLTSSNELLRPNLERTLRSGSRVVSHDFEVRGWNPVKVLQEEAHGRMHRIFVYRMPTSR